MKKIIVFLSLALLMGVAFFSSCTKEYTQKYKLEVFIENGKDVDTPAEINAANAFSNYIKTKACPCDEEVTIAGKDRADCFRILQERVNVYAAQFKTEDLEKICKDVSCPSTTLRYGCRVYKNDDSSQGYEWAAKWDYKYDAE